MPGPLIIFNLIHEALQKTSYAVLREIRGGEKGPSLPPLSFSNIMNSYRKLFHLYIQKKKKKKKKNKCTFNLISQTL